jgi:hypothetical protein
LEYTETILWWLILEKLYLKAKYPKQIGDFVYHHIEIAGKRMNDRDENKLDMLHSFAIPVKYHFAKTYPEGYLLAAEKIKTGSKAKYEKQQRTKIEKATKLIADNPVTPTQNP